MSNSKTYGNRANLQRVLIASACAFLFLPTLIPAQWSTDPNSNLIVGYGLLPEIASDSVGGCYITYEQNLAYPRRLVLNRLDRYGYKPWGTNRRILGEYPEQYSAQLTEDGHGGVIVAYVDRWADSILAWRVRVQRVDSSGNFLWGPTGVRVSLSETDQGSQAIVSDGIGGCIVAWRDTANTLRIQMISPTGTRVWSDSGLYLYNDGGDAPVMTADPSGGVVMSWRYQKLQRINTQGHKVWSDTGITTAGGAGQLAIDNGALVYASGREILGIRNGELLFILTLQQLDTLGMVRWPGSGVVLDTINTNLSISAYLVVKNNGCSTIAWPHNVNGEWDIRVQIVRRDGGTIFSHGGIPVSAVVSRKNLYGVVPSESSTSVVVWSDNRAPGGTFAQRLDTSGLRLWDGRDILVSNPPFSGGGKTTTDGAGGFIVAGFVQSDFSIRAQQVSKNGNLGEVITFVQHRSTETSHEFTLHQNYPNPFNPATNISYVVPTSSWINISLYNILGQRLATVINSYHLPGKYSAHFQADGFPSGVYYYQMSCGIERTLVRTRKLLFIK